MASALYRGIIRSADKFVPSKLRPLWEHEAGPKTIFFWAPAVKWSLVIAGLGDLQRPVEKLSVPQSASLAATGIIWSRYSMVLVLASVGDMSRPLDKVSPKQTASLAATGFIWARYSLVIIPKNYALCICNFFVGVTNAVQCARAYDYRRKHPIAE